MHARLRCGVSKLSLALDYGQVLRDHVISPLVKQGTDGVDQAVCNMREYSLLRDDLDGLLEVTQWPDKPDPLKNVETKTKAAFTRKYKKERMALPYSIATTATKKKESVGGDEDMVPGEEEEEIDNIDVDVEEEEEIDNIEKDASIKMNKRKRRVTGTEDGSGSKVKCKGEGRG